MCNLTHDEMKPIPREPIKLGGITLQEDPTMVPVKTPTKFGKFLSFVMPILEGAAVGGFGGSRHPEGGFGEASDFFRLRRHEMLNQRLLDENQRQQAFQNELALHREEREAALAEAHGRYYNSRAGYGGGAPGVDITSESWHEGVPSSADMIRAAGGMSEADFGGGGALVREGPFAGMVFDKDSGTLAPATLPGSSVMQSVRPGDALSPRVPRRATGPDLARSTAERERARPHSTIRETRNAGGTEQDVVVDTNPASPTFGKRIGTTDVQRSPLPKEPKESDKRDAEETKIEQYAAQALDQNGGDADRAIGVINKLTKLDPNLKSKVRQRIRERVRPGKSRGLRLSPQERQQLLEGGVPQ